MKKYILLLITFCILSSHTADEGMFPLTEISRIDLAKAGLKIPVSEVYNPNGVSLVDAIVRIGGCTGSFISNDGLVITNHHCGFSSVSSASDSIHNYLRDGFYADARDKEIKTGLTTKIIDSYADVSATVLAGTDMADDVARTNAIRNNIQSIIKSEQGKNKSLDYEVSEMFTGRTYILFRYKTIKDIRIVYNPPLAIGEFGGETDNWVWPRHNGDFCIMRAYVAPDGTPAEYNKNNVPFHPKRFLKVNAKGIKENDFVFILGFPGRTFRHVPSRFVAYQQQYQMPFIVDLYEWQIAKMQELGKGSDSKQLAYASRIKGLANTSKNYRGKLQGLERTGLVAQKQKEEKRMHDILQNNSSMQTGYSHLFADIDDAYNELTSKAWKNLWLQQIYNVQHLMDASSDYVYLKKLYAVNDTAAISKTSNDIKNALAQYNAELELPLLAHMISMALAFPEGQHIKAVDEHFKGMTEAAIALKLKQMISKSVFSKTDKVKASLDKKNVKALKTSDAFCAFNESLNAEYAEYDAFIKPWQSKMALLTKKYNDVEMLMNITTYTPDANSTLRLTYGYIKGYSPQDAVYHKPFTTLQGILEKETPSGDFVMPPLLKSIIVQKMFGEWYDKVLGDVPVAFLYNLDTTGGNSGSPVLDAYGQFIGINFDRAFTATINDYAWNENYSRSIGCDARYICFVLEQYSHADGLLKEMGVKN